ncbi:MAG TPA: hypothetical protein V6C69_18830 [Trichormus sp.]
MLFNLSARTRYLMAGDPHVSAAFLDQLSHSHEPSVRARVAEHQNTPLGTLFRLVQDDYTEVRQGLAFNPNRTSVLLRLLAEDDDPDVRYLIAEDTQAPPAILHFLSDDENPYVAHRAQQTLSRFSKVTNLGQLSAWMNRNLPLTGGLRVPSQAAVNS